MDVFLLDALTEMLSTPLRLLSYVGMRVHVLERVVLSHEFTALGFHLKRNLWLESDIDMVMLDDAISVDLDTAMTVRRENVPGVRTPPGILTRLSGTLYERLIQQLEDRADPASLATGLELLSMSEGSCRNVHDGLQTITLQTRADGRRHDFTLAQADGGLCFHCNPAATDEAKKKLGGHCAMRKYRMRAPRWYGVSVDAHTSVQFGVALDFPWEQSESMDEITHCMKDSMPPASLSRSARAARKLKVGRNDPCPCGSGTKYKRCCMP